MIFNTENSEWGKKNNYFNSEIWLLPFMQLLNSHKNKSTAPE